MKTILSAALLGLAAANTEAFMEHITHFNLSYGTRAEFEFRFERFMEADAAIKELNASDELATYGHNHLSTWTLEEKLRLSSAPQGEFDDDAQEADYLEESNSYDAIDWRDEGAVTWIQDQGACGSCWAFGSTAALEGNYKIQHGELIKMSEQQLVDCIYSRGCNGGWDYWIYNYLTSAKFMKLIDYPYVAKDQTCQYNSELGVYSTTGYQTVPRNNPSQMYSALKQGPLSVTIRSQDPIFWQYKGGLMNLQCIDFGDHIVAVVGYGVENGTEYWLIKNSWGFYWGEYGYGKIIKDDSDGSACIQQVPKRPYV